jgi:hypothetical protein
MHGHVGDRVADYIGLVKTLEGLQGYAEKDGNHHVAVGRSELIGSQIFLVIYTGYSEKSTLFFDLAEKKELTEATSPNRFPARKTYAMIDGARRFLILESKKGGLSALSLSSVIEKYAQRNQELKLLELSFNPIADKEFASRLVEFRRIRSATITIARPNVDWTDRHTQLTQVANESDAKALDVTARSRKGQSLSKDHGLIQFIKESATSAKSMFQKIRIVGSFGDDSSLITLDLNKHVQQLNVTLDTDSATGLPRDSDVRKNLSAYLDKMGPESKES